MAERKDFMNQNLPTWCPGCGNFGLWQGFIKAVSELGKEPHEVCMVFDIGCGGNGANWNHTYAFHSLHGRTLPVANAIKMTNHKLTVIADAGDGGGYGEGGNHFLHACRMNSDITYLVHDNQVYGLTTGQVTPTSEKGMKGKSTPQGLIETPLNPLQTAIVAGATFVARTYTGNIAHEVEIMKAAMSHKGFAVVDIFQPCVTYNKINTNQFFQQRTYELGDDWDPSDKNKALIKAGEVGEKIPLGIFFREERQTYEESLSQIQKKTLLEQKDDIPNISQFYQVFK
ncbi:MAG: 2-oxoacid ferredoxin oxidoreductase [Candidatus Buchananbacteria bacterium CG10_big_fil_rev_8_21_14_0_10_42_9]|uniref:2-oxoacid ferredoxin oxidoreductase n=1 Tax=Candidatus Buchananbacteria bacterium CG10_big_fil_rev_8_21_14_0_10_42_9 TaxID=1974526 RepID=A0A2H0W0Q6_9BACT|nr:MAG: 2-oxoacid ferredoxin oxidoreductase [Candidatus Buchananbacteria bacterium CG10_big_fil_rev_8_21_14_0_10_42_9]